MSFKKIKFNVFKHKKMSFKKMNVPPQLKSPTIVPEVSSNLTKWIPLLCAGAAAGISIMALKEIKNVRNELIHLKKDNNTKGNDSELTKKMELLEEQLKTITDYLKNKDTVDKRKNIIIKNVIPQEEQEVKIIDNDEYEEIEVTDDEEN